jgi:hypothetical protein
MALKAFRYGWLLQFLVKTSRQPGNGILSLKTLKLTGSAYDVMQL